MIKASTRIAGAPLVWGISYFFFLVNLANNFSASHDSINYLNHIVRGEHLFHQHHLLYHFLANKWMHVFGSIFQKVPEHYLVETFTAFWGSSMLTICYAFFRNRFNLPRILSALGVCVIAFSYGVWFYSVNIEVYMPPLFFILCSLFVITRKDPKRNDIWLIAVLHSLAILFHQVNVLFGFVILYWIFTNRHHFNAAKAFLKYFITGLIVTGGIYFMVGWFIEGNNSARQFTEWILGYTVGHGYWQPLSLKTPFQVLTGFSRAFIGAHFIFQIPAVDQFLENSFRAHTLKDEIFLSEQISAGFAWFLSFVAIVFCVLLLFLVIRFIRRFRSMKLHFHVLRPLLLCLLVYSLFFIFWMPEILEFWILQMVLVWLMIVGMLPVFRFPFRLPASGGMIVLALSLFIVNYFGSIRWLGDIRNDWFYIEVKKIADIKEGDLVILENEWILKDYVRYYTPATVMADDEPDFSTDAVKKKVKEVIAAKGRVFLYNNKSRATAGWQLIQSY